MKIVDKSEKEIEAPYELPEEWKWCSLEKLCSIPITDGTHQTPIYSDEENGIPFISSKDVTKKYIDWENIKYITKELHTELYKRVAPKIDDILLAKNGTTGVAAIVDNDKIFDIYVTLALLRPNKDLIVPNYLLNVVNSPICKNQFDEHLTGIGVPNLHLRDIKLTQIPLPPTLEEQQRIVNRIETLFAKLDQAKEKAQNVVDTFETRKASILHKAFTGELTKKWRAENGVGDDSWEEKKIGDCLICIKDKYDPTKDEKLEMPYIGLENIEKGIGIVSIGDSSLVKSIKTLFKINDLLYGKLRPYLDKHDVASFDGMCSTDILVYRSNDENDIHYFNYIFSQKQFMLYAMENSKGINLPRTSELEISNFVQKVPMPPEQKEIVRILDCVLEKENQAKEAAIAVLEQIDLLKKSIPARAFRGEL